MEGISTTPKQPWIGMSIGIVKPYPLHQQTTHYMLVEWLEFQISYKFVLEKSMAVDG